MNTSTTDDQVSDSTDGIVLTLDQLEAWAGRKLTPDEIAQLDDAIPNSSIPEAIGDIAANLDVYEMHAPQGYVVVEYANGVVHGIDMLDWTDGPLWRVAPVCDAAGPGVSSDEAASEALRPGLLINCSKCISILT